MVIATPVDAGDELIPQATIEQTVNVDKIGLTSSTLPQQRMGCLMPCELGSRYKIEVNRVCDILEMKISDPSDPVYVIVGESVATPIGIDLNLEHTMGTTDFIKVAP